MNNEIVTYSVLKKYVTGNCKSTFISHMGSKRAAISKCWFVGVLLFVCICMGSPSYLEQVYLQFTCVLVQWCYANNRDPVDLTWLTIELSDIITFQKRSNWVVRVFLNLTTNVFGKNHRKWSLHIFWHF